MKTKFKAGDVVFGSGFLSSGVTVVIPRASVIKLLGTEVSTGIETYVLNMGMIEVYGKSDKLAKMPQDDFGQKIDQHPARHSGGPVSEAQLRKMQPVGTIIREYFPDALRAVSAVSWVGNEKHNPGQHLHWARGKSDDHVDCDARHFIDAAKGDGWDTTELPDGRAFAVLHAAQHAWRALAQLQLEIEKNGGEVIRVVKVPQAGETA